MNPQLSRKEEISKGCGRKYCPSCERYTNDEYSFKCGQLGLVLNGKDTIMLCDNCQARLDERIRAEQDFLRMIDSWWGTQKAYYITEEDIEELKSTIKQEKTE